MTRSANPASTEAGRRGDTAPSGEGTRALPVLVGGCLLVGASSTFIKLSGATAPTAAFVRCALAAVLLAPVALGEWRRYGLPHRRGLGLAAASGVLLAADYLMWTQSVLDTGAAVATVLIGVQVVVFPVLALLLLDMPIARRFWLTLPVMLLGLVLTSGLLGADPGAPAPLRGAVLGVLAGGCYAGYLLTNRQAAVLDPRQIVTPVAVGTTAAALVIAAVSGLASRTPAGGALTIDLGAVDAGGWVWLVALAIGGQVLSFVAISYGSARLAPSRAGAVMLLQPVAAIALGTLALGERPDAAQVLGMALTVIGVGLATIGRRRR